MIINVSFFSYDDYYWHYDFYDDDDYDSVPPDDTAARVCLAGRCYRTTPERVGPGPVDQSGPANSSVSGPVNRSASRPGNGLVNFSASVPIRRCWRQSKADATALEHHDPHAVRAMYGDSLYESSFIRSPVF